MKGLPQSDLLGLYGPEGASFRPATSQDYARRLQEFVYFRRSRNADFQSNHALDTMVCLFFEVKFQEGAPSADSSNFLAALCFALPSLRRRIATSLPRASRGLRGWSKIAPPDQRLPFPLVLLCAVLGSGGCCGGERSPRPSACCSSSPRT